MEVLCFGIARDITGASSIRIEGVITVAELKDEINHLYPKFKEIKKCMIAVNQEYAEDSLILNINDDVAIIPPVSGG